MDAVQGRNESLGKLPIGWGSRVTSVAWPDYPLVTRFIGWLLTAVALSLGAPFWFDLLNKLVNMRHGMQKPQVAPMRPQVAPQNPQVVQEAAK
jgi:hypothetical protein